MKATTEMVLTDNLKALNLSHMLRQLGAAAPAGPGTRGWTTASFSLALTEIELQMRGGKPPQTAPAGG